MSGAAFASLDDALRDDHFPEVDLALRRGRHIGREDGAAYEFLADAARLLEPLYRRLGCELVHRTDGYFHLLSPGARIGARQLTDAEMLVGQTLALLYLDPATLRHGGAVGRDVVLQRLAGMLGNDTLVRMLNPPRKRHDERIAAAVVRGKVDDALRELAELGFVEALADGRVRLRAALMRFTEPVRGLQPLEESLARLAARGELVLGPPRDTDERGPA